MQSQGADNLGAGNLDGDNLDADNLSAPSPEMLKDLEGREEMVKFKSRVAKLQQSELLLNAKVSNASQLQKKVVELKAVVCLNNVAVTKAVQPEAKATKRHAEWQEILRLVRGERGV